MQLDAILGQARGKPAAILPALTGCTAVGPDYVSVEPQAPDEWYTKIEGGLTATEIKTVGPARWWTILKDPELDKIEDRAIKGNLDLKQARARIRKARALRGINRESLSHTGRKRLGGQVSQ